MPDPSRSLPEAIACLEVALAECQPVQTLADLGGARFLGLLLQLTARRLVRQGPVEDSLGWLTPSGLLSAAQDAATGGLLGVSTVVELRRLLEEAGHAVRRAGAWRDDQDLWWEPLARGHELEEMWSEFDRRLSAPDGFKEPHSFGTSLRSLATARPLLLMPSFLSGKACRSLSGELEKVYQAGALDLEPGKIGSASETAASASARSDEVRFTCGLEPDLLRMLPVLAVLAQWLLERLAVLLKESFLDREIHPPVTAMLARYPAGSSGFRPHLDNPGGAAENGRALSCVLYLTDSTERRPGGELALWASEMASPSAPTEVMRPMAGSLALFDSRSVLHEVRPLAPGGPRWSLVMWMNDEPQVDLVAPPLSALTTTEVLLPIESPPVSEGRVLRHELSNDDQYGIIVVGSKGSKSSRVGIVSTVRGAGRALEMWCRHHFSVGFEHLVLVFDRLEEAAEAATAEALRELFPPSQLAIWSSAQLRDERWQQIRAATGDDELLRAADEGDAPQAVASRQALNASAALQAAATEEFGGSPLDWLVHLDHDELFYLHGNGRGGVSAHEHFATLDTACIGLTRYVNHELLLPRQRGGGAMFKRNPHLARARLGPAGWLQFSEDLRIEQSHRRPYFNGYLNGKSAVAIEAGRAAAGVHDWFVAPECHRRFLAGPSILHFHFASAEGYVRKYLEMESMPEGERLFQPCRTELEGYELVETLRQEGASEEVMRSRLLALRDTVAGFADDEVEILEEAGLILKPDLAWPLPVDSVDG